MNICFTEDFNFEDDIGIVRRTAVMQRLLNSFSLTDINPRTQTYTTDELEENITLMKNRLLKQQNTLLKLSQNIVEIKEEEAKQEDNSKQLKSTTTLSNIHKNTPESERTGTSSSTDDSPSRTSISDSEREEKENSHSKNKPKVHKTINQFTKKAKLFERNSSDDSDFRPESGRSELSSRLGNNWSIEEFDNLQTQFLEYTRQNDMYYENQYRDFEEEEKKCENCRKLERKSQENRNKNYRKDEKFIEKADEEKNYDLLPNNSDCNLKIIYKDSKKTLTKSKSQPVIHKINTSDKKSKIVNTHSNRHHSNPFDSSDSSSKFTDSLDVSSKPAMTTFRELCNKNSFRLNLHRDVSTQVEDDFVKCCCNKLQKDFQLHLQLSDVETSERTSSKTEDTKPVNFCTRIHNCCGFLFRRTKHY